MPTVPSDFRLYHGNDLEMLAAVLASELKKPCAGQSLLTPETILIPQPAMRRWLQKTLAEAHGIAANLEFLTPGEFVRHMLDANVAGTADAVIGDAATLRWRLWSRLLEPRVSRERIFAPVAAVLAAGQHVQNASVSATPGNPGAARSLAAWSLAGELASAFEKYQAWRRDWLRHWDRGGDREDWQAELWRRATAGLSHRGARLDAYLERFGAEGSEVPSGISGRIFAFGCQSVSPDVLRVIASAARAGTLNFFFLSPVRGWWGDLRTATERLRAAPEAVFEDDENPLLRANGAAGRDFVRTLFSYDVVHPDWELALYAPPDPARRTGLLHRLQRDLLERRPLPDIGDPSLPEFAVPDLDARADRDRSLQVHACHTRLREVQVLHEQLRDLLEHDSSLQPRDIAVLMPDVDLYAPAIHAVFGAPDIDTGAVTPSRFIPYAITEGNALLGQPLVAAFLRVLALPTARFTVNEVLDVLAVPAIADRFGLQREDFDRLHEPLRLAGARWGLDARHRSGFAAPAESAYSWAWALDRLLLGHATGDDVELAGVAPLPLLEGDALSRLDALLEGLRVLAKLQQMLGRAQSATQWRTRLAQALDELVPMHGLAADDQRARDWLQRQIARFGEQTGAAGLDGEVPPEVVRAWFLSALREDDTRQPFLTGGVTIARMVPLRLIPFRVICLLGMNDGEYPRRDPVGALNRLSAALTSSSRRIGDRSIRDDDRGLFLQMLAAAGDCFYLSYLGADPRSGETIPPSVVVSELVEVAARYFRNSDDARANLIVHHPLQPFAANAFGRGDARRISHRAEWRPPSDSGDVAPALPPFFAALPAEETPAHATVTRDQLYRTLANPAKAFLRERLGLRLDEIEQRLPEVEPFDGNDHLRRHALEQRIFSALIAGEMDRDSLRQRLLAEGRIAPGAVGAQETRDLIDVLRAPAEQWQRWAQGSTSKRRFELNIAGHALTGTLDDVFPDALLQFRAGKAHGRNQLRLGLDALIWSALGETRPIRRLILGEGARELAPVPVDVARQALSVLIDAGLEARRQPLPFMPKAAFAYAELADRDEARAWRAATEHWRGRDGFGEGQDRWVRLAGRGQDPFADPDSRAAQDFRHWARRIFDPLLAINNAGGVQ